MLWLRRLIFPRLPHLDVRLDPVLDRRRLDNLARDVERGYGHIAVAPDRGVVELVSPRTK
jgi:hypothetical protein